MTMTILESNGCEVDGRLGVVVAELSGLVLRLQRQLDGQRAALAGLRAELAQEVRTARIIVDSEDGKSSTEITPGYVDVHCEPDAGDPTSGSFIHLCSVSHAAVLTVGSGSPGGRDADVVATMFAGFENVPGSAFVEVSARGQRETIEVEVPEPVAS